MELSCRWLSLVEGQEPIVGQWLPLVPRPVTMSASTSHSGNKVTANVVLYCASTPVPLPARTNERLTSCRSLHLSRRVLRVQL